jgi:hypothetical protein
MTRLLIDFFSFPVSRLKQIYVIGGQRYATRPDGAAMVGPQERRLPIISFAGVCIATVFPHYHE